MARTTNYAWLVYGAGGPSNPTCQMDAYYSDPSHSPQHWQETLHGKDKDEAIIIVEQDKWSAEQIPNGEGYTQSTINAAQKWYYRTSKATGNSWEVVLNEEGNEVPSPCGPPTEPDPRDVSVSMANCKMTLTYDGDVATLTVKGRVIPPAATKVCDHCT